LISLYVYYCGWKKNRRKDFSICPRSCKPK
jgi:hypothetical protein